jgi:hypothetical protein
VLHVIAEAVLEDKIADIGPDSSMFDVRGPANFKNREVHKIAIVTIAEQFGTSDTFHANTETCSYTIYHKQQQPCL